MVYLCPLFCHPILTFGYTRGLLLREEFINIVESQSTETLLAFVVALKQNKRIASLNIDQTSFPAQNSMPCSDKYS